MAKIKIKDPALKDKMMGYMWGKPEMAPVVAAMDNTTGWPAVETPDTQLEITKPIFDWWSSDEKISFVSGLFGNEPIVEPIVETPMV